MRLMFFRELNEEDQILEVILANVYFTEEQKLFFTPLFSSKLFTLARIMNGAGIA